MSHTLHRSGSVESLKNDFPMLALGARGFNREGCAARIFELAGIVVKYSTANAGIIGFPDKLTPENLKDAQPLFTDTTVFHAVFTDEKELAACMKELHEADLGISVVVSGLFDSVHSCCQKAGLEPHTVNMSLGVWGNTEEKLPQDERISQVSSMCGHGMVPFSLVEDAAEKVRSCKLSPHDAALRLSSSCTCHIFNPERAERILREYLS